MIVPQKKKKNVYKSFVIIPTASIEKATHR